MPLNSLKPWLALALVSSLFPALAQQLHPSPDFSQSKIAAAADEMKEAWNTWQQSSANLELEVFTLPMTEGRQRIQKSYQDVLAFLEKRAAYNAAVLEYIQSSHSGNPTVSVDTVNADEIELLGVSLSVIQKKLDTLRPRPDWTRLRRSVQPNRTEILELQDSRRQDIQIERPLSVAASNVRPISSLVYENTERQSRESIQKLWTRYYQALVDSVEQKPGGSAPLLSTPAKAPPVPARSPEHPLVGTWTYADGSQQFNGVAEPRQVVLELWIEKGALLGRYRAELQDFDGPKRVDLNLRGKLVNGNIQTLDFHSTDPEAAGKIVLEGPGPTGLELMLVRSVDTGATIPRGRELLNRR